MKRGMSGRTRRGAPPLARQRGALRVVQLTLLAMAVVLGSWAVRAWESRAAAAPQSLGGSPAAPVGEVLVLGVCSVASFTGALAIGVRTVRGPVPPTLD